MGEYESEGEKKLRARRAHRKRNGGLSLCVVVPLAIFIIKRCRAPEHSNCTLLYHVTLGGLFLFSFVLFLSIISLRSLGKYIVNATAVHLCSSICRAHLIIRFSRNGNGMEAPPPDMPAAFEKGVESQTAKIWKLATDLKTCLLGPFSGHDHRSARFCAR